MRPASRQYPREDRARVVSSDARDLVPVRRGLGALWSADDGVTLNALAASAWQDFAPGAASNLAQSTGASQPTLVPFAAGARSALRFDGSNDVLSRAITSAVQPSARGLSIVFVAQGRSGSTGDCPPIVGARPWTALTDAGYSVAMNGSRDGGRLTAHFADGSTGFDHIEANSVATRGLSTTQREMWCVVFDSVAQRLRFFANGALDVERAPTWPSGTITITAGLNVGADLTAGSGTRRLACDLFRLAIHSEALTAGEVAAYWARWGPLCGVRP